MIQSKFLLVLTIIIALLSAGCTKHNPVIQNEDKTMDNLEIPDGFNFKSTKDVEIEVNMPDSVDFTNLRSRLDIFTSNPEDGGKLINSSSFNNDGHYKGTIRIPVALQEIYLKTIAGNIIVNLPASGQKSGGVIINFGDDYSYSAPDTIEPTQKSYQFQLNQEKQLKAVSNVIGNGDFSNNDFGSVPNWNTIQTVDRKWHFTNYYYGSMEWFNDNGNEVIRTPKQAANNSSYYNGGSSQWIDAEPGDVISFTADIKADGGSRLYSYLYLIPRRSNGSYIRFYSTYLYNPPSDWTTKTIVASMPAGTAYCQVLIWNTDYESNGSIYYDNVIVTGPVVDSDNDGVSDEEDDYPNDAARAFNIYFPDATNLGSFAFEDNWPGRGDYDFNDLVVDYRYKQVVNSGNELVDLEAIFKFKASGATFLNGFGFEMGLAPNDIASVTGTSIVDGYITTLGNGSEAGQAKGTIIVTDNIFTQIPNPGGGIGTNTSPSAPYIQPETLNIKVSLDNPISLDVTGTPPYNPFIIVNEERGREVHLADNPPTSLANTNYFGTEHDNSNLAAGKYYKTQNNLPWAIDIPIPFDYPIEKAQIINTHLKFATWAESGGVVYTDWYKDLNGYRNSGNIFQIPN